METVTTDSDHISPDNGRPSNLHSPKKTLFGNVLSRWPFSRPLLVETVHDDLSPSSQYLATDGEAAYPPNLSEEKVVAAQGRKRKGSLRKAALLGTGLLGLDRRNSTTLSPRRKSLLQQRSNQTSPTKSELPQKPTFELPLDNSSSEAVPRGVSVDTDSISPESGTDVASSVTSPLDLNESPTEDDGALPPLQSVISNAGSPPSALKNPSPSLSPSSSDSSSLVPTSPARHRSSSKHVSMSPLAPGHIIEFASPPEDWDYSETEWWGWVVLIVTWIVFVVGMGSCLDLWSWAWDVGETPYAPPEFEDDPTLPIVGYYPALIILTAVMSWVWVVIAWVGMKYFKHAKIQGEDG